MLAAARNLMRPLARAVRSAAARADRAAVTWAGPAPRGAVRVSYGHRSIPRPDEHAMGGIVKLQSLATMYPHCRRRFNILYLVSSRLPEEPVLLARAARRAGARLVLNQNGVAYRAWFGPGWERVNAPMAELLQMADHVFYQSEFCRRTADRFAAEASGPSEILYNVVDTNVFAPAATRRGGPLTLLLGGTQEPWYRLESALQVLARVSREVPDARLLVAGRLRLGGDPATDRARADACARSLGVAARVEYLGPYTQVQAPDIYRRADLLLHTKYNDPCPAVVVEALASGLPVVYSVSGGVPELVGPDAGIGVPVPEDWEREHAADPDAMAAAVVRVWADRERFAQAARQRVVTRLGLDAWMERHSVVFADLAAMA